MTLVQPPAEATAAVPHEGMALADFLRRQDEQPFELIDGKEYLISPSMYGSGDVLSLLLEALFAYNAPLKLGRIYADTTFVLPDTVATNWVKGSRVPDAMFYTTQRLEAYRAQTPDVRIKPLMLVPDLAVEIVSPTDWLPNVWSKAALYLKDGVRLVWVINPVQEVVTIYTPDRAPVTLEKAATLTGGDVMPDFTLALSALFEG